MKRATKSGDTNVVESAALVLDGRSRRRSLRQILPFMGPAFIASILALEAYGFRPLETVITGMVGVIAVCYLIETWLVHPDWAQVAWHAVVPQFAGRESVFVVRGSAAPR